MASCTTPLWLPIKEPGENRPARDARLQQVACGKCMACRLNHARNWSTRLMHEATFHEENSFLTLTYSDQHLPDPPSLSKREMQLFIKRLRKQLDPVKVRYFACGEYGGSLGRPHYHVILFGHSFRSDRYPWSKIRENIYYRSPQLEEAWPFGHSTISDVTPQSAGYVARYSVKKANYHTQTKGEPYTRIIAQTGEVYVAQPEFLVMSTRPGIGFGWIDRFGADAFPSGFLIVDGKRVPVPAAYRRRIKAKGTFDLQLAVEETDYDRYLMALKNADDDTPERRAVKDELLRLRTQNLKRDYE